MKIAAGIIIFNSDFVLKQVLDSIYPYMNQILISEGCVTYWKNKGFTTSTDRTNEILRNYPDPDKKITIVNGTYHEKTEQANAYMKYVQSDTDYVWNIDADEVFKPEDIQKVIELLEKEKYTSVGFKSYSFYGGFERYLTGFEQEHEFIRIRKYHSGAIWSNHRPPTIELLPHEEKKHLSYNTLAQIGIFMYHYSYVFPRQVFEKINYYENAVISVGNCIPNYFKDVYLSWICGDTQDKYNVEQTYNGVHEFMPHTRGECRTERFTGSHPNVIIRDLNKLNYEWKKQLNDYIHLLNN